MALRPPSAGLRQFHNKSNDVAKIQILVPAGDAIAVTDYVASQLTSAFTEGEAPKPVADEPADAPKPAAKKSTATRKS